ncbi:MAG: hypothetical protein WCO52_02485 [bacterium]
MKQETQFGSHMDWWVATGVVVLLVILVLMIPSTIFLVHTPLSSIIVAIGLVVSILLLVDRVFFTSYELLPEALLIRSQLRHYVIPYRSMRRVRRGSVMSLLSRGRHKRFALSHENIVISLVGETWKTVSVSPVGGQQFTAILLDMIEDDRIHRIAPSVRHGS